MSNPENNVLAGLMCLFSLCVGLHVQAAEPQRIVIDEAHRQFTPPSKKPPLRYEIKSGDSILLDASAYTFSPAEGDDEAEPNAVQFILDKQRQFNTAWDAEARQALLNKSTLIGRFGAFEGAKSGDTFVLVIGRQVVNAAKQEGFFRVQWVGMGSVK